MAIIVSGKIIAGILLNFLIRYFGENESGKIKSDSLNNILKGEA